MARKISVVVSKWIYPGVFGATFLIWAIWAGLSVLTSTNGPEDVRFWGWAMAVCTTSITLCALLSIKNGGGPEADPRRRWVPNSQMPGGFWVSMALPMILVNAILLW